ncbi:hypothetical protein PQ478_08910 [Alkalihalophilus pseudofirmus]|uniref:hypothetical protein n=1 Tax=Alkalihalophilus pseudofirmus TaxID=79885 RepID=UPI00259BD6D6|nr:hypothetical protein [Alkalihalophilus pseudofirmus]WEG18590.1 hypothetical protein PQ478_08910 [Alkalihalophilus pseudofirmus]
MNKMVYQDMLLDIKMSLNSFIRDGLTGGFQFDEECASELQRLEDKISYVIEEQQNEIDYLKDALKHRKHQTEVHVDTILELKDKIKSLEGLTDLQDKMIEHDDRLNKQTIEENERMKIKLSKIQAMYDDIGLSDEDFINEIDIILED